MRQKVTSMFLSAVFGVCVCGCARAPVAASGDRYAVADSWRLKKLAGRSLIPLAAGNYPRWKEPNWDSELRKLPLFADMGYTVSAKFGDLQDVYRKGFGWKNDKIFLRPADELRTKPYGMTEFMNRVKTFSGANLLIRGIFEDGDPIPFAVSFEDGRPAAFLRDGYNADRADYLAWRARHPGFLGFGVLSEYDNDIGQYNGNVETMPEGPVRQTLLSRLPVAKDGKAWMEQLRTVYRREKEMYFGEDALTWALHSVNCSLAHRYAAVGIRGLVYEAALDCYGAPFAFGGAFVRGAARQYDIPYRWYTAQLLGAVLGRRRDGTAAAGEIEWPGSWVGYAATREARPWLGTGVSLFKRNLAYGMLIGASTIQPESTQFFLFEDGPDGKKHPSVWAKAWNDVYVFGRDHDRGTPYTPVAILTSLYEDFMRHGYNVNNRDPHSQNAFFWTLVPTLKEDVYRLSDGKKGDLGGLFNSPFGEIWDDLAPDAGQDSAAFAKALSAYRAAFLVGDFSQGELDVPALVAYVRNGGTLFVSCDQIADGHFPSDVAGVSFGSATDDVGVFFTDASGARIALKDPYTAVAGTAAKDAKPVLFAAGGQPFAWARACGRGRVVTVGVHRFMPDARVWSTKKKELWSVDQQSIASGKRTFPLVKYLLERVQADYMPCAVTGSCQWGVNRTADGWLFWAFNNDGVIKFAGEPDEFDLSKTSHVKVTFKKDAGGAAFEFDLKPGAIRTVTVKGGDCVASDL